MIFNTLIFEKYVGYKDVDTWPGYQIIGQISRFVVIR
jgi:hypothetical protein